MPPAITVPSSASVTGKPLSTLTYAEITGYIKAADTLDSGHDVSSDFEAVMATLHRS